MKSSCTCAEATRLDLKYPLTSPLNVDWDGNELLLSDVMGTDSDIVYRCIEEQVDKSLLDDAMQRLSTREKRIVELRFGLGDGKEKTQKEVADLLGISQSYISRAGKEDYKKIEARNQKSRVNYRDLKGGPILNTYDLMKKYVASQAIDYALSLLAKDPQRNLVTLTRILELFAGGPNERKQIQMARKAFEDPDHVWTKLAERGFSELHASYRTRGLVNLFINEAYMGQQERKLHAEELGTPIPSLLVISRQCGVI